MIEEDNKCYASEVQVVAMLEPITIESSIAT